ncbi:hypothetical protein TDB9533_00014 [Thalassocella blandensis]|nr:hypothetical protein TDB9533_00014 [Thalassocella blandensis]
MPFTPFHMGPGLLVKALLQGCFSVMVFGWAQIVMDIQPLIVLLTGQGHLHGFTHTYIGATLIAIFSALSGKYLGEFGLKLLSIPAINSHITWRVALISAFAGSLSHVLLDSIMHHDVQPFFPFSESNRFLGLISVATLHKLCIYSGLIGAIAFYIIQHTLNRRSAEKGLDE